MKDIYLAADDSGQDALSDCDDEDDSSDEQSGPPKAPPLGLMKYLKCLGAHRLQTSRVQA